MREMSLTSSISLSGKNARKTARVLGAILLACFALPSIAGATCYVPDNGLGTADLPIPCPYYTPIDDMNIVDGLPPGTTVEIDAILSGMAGVEIPFGVYAGGNSQSYSGILAIPLIGTGTLAGYSRPGMTMPVTGSTGSNSRSPYMATQSFNTEMFQLQGQLLGDPDFDLLRITAGTSFGLPSPGHTTLTQAGGGNWAVDSFFDITYRIDFVGAPGSPLAGMSGSTTGTIRFQTEPVPEPGTIVLLCAAGMAGLAVAIRKRKG
ncbi:MAG: PEP-CTERM sorting domain-containing protein [Pirellulales bacterium]|nr:PEP-CTERM sorting domain-containing protein [Pirellulales bacterium]